MSRSHSPSLHGLDRPDCPYSDWIAALSRRDSFTVGNARGLSYNVPDIIFRHAQANLLMMALSVERVHVLDH